ncbi:LmeA family phospholipid-binding protein [Streptomyces cynarae]|uniref:LmeA family phospholipid-binding protein n=1 Tax=Streptomyces cynarae TaxID=2981134 RepID=UPI00406D2202
MRALRILLILVVILGGLFVIADRVAVHFAQNEAADKLKTTENLATTPDVSIKGFPFLTQVLSGELDDVEVGIKDYDATTGNGSEKIRIDDLNASMKGVTFSGSFSSATAADATGTALITYDELLKTAKSQPTDVAPGVTARVIGLSDGGNGKIKVAVKVEAPALGVKLPNPVYVLSSVTAQGNTVRVHADNLPELAGMEVAGSRIRTITDFQQRIDQLPGGIKLDKVQAAKDGVEITVKGSDVRLAG